MNTVWSYIFVLGVMGTVVAQAQEVLINRAIYTFQNKADFGFLTSIGGLRAVPVAKFADSDIWRDAPSQKWMVVKGLLSSSFMLKPTSEVGEALFVNRNVVSRGSSGFGLSSSQYWTVRPIEKGFYNIRNSQTEDCLESPGIGRRVFTSRCRNVPQQQWAIHRR